MLAKGLYKVTLTLTLIPTLTLTLALALARALRRARCGAIRPVVARIRVPVRTAGPRHDDEALPHLWQGR